MGCWAALIDLQADDVVLILLIENQDLDPVALAAGIAALLFA